jgi:hypothetical protein
MLRGPVTLACWKAGEGWATAAAREGPKGREACLVINRLFEPEHHI